MADAAAQIGITITGEDRSSPAFASASRGAEQLQRKAASLGGTLKALPGGFSKAAGAMNAMGGAFGQTGGAVGGFIGKLSGLAGLLVGGPLGIAIAAVTVTVGALNAAFGKSKEEMEAADKAAEKLREELERLRQANVDIAKETASLRLDTAYVGAANGMREFAELQMQYIEQEQKLARMRRDSSLSHDVLVVEEDRQRAMWRKMTALAELISKTEEKERVEKAAATAEAAARAKAEEATRKQREELRRLNEEIDKALAKNIPELPPVPGGTGPIELTQQEIDAINEAAAAEQARGTITKEEKERFIEGEKAKIAYAKQTADVMAAVAMDLTQAALANTEEGRRVAISAALDKLTAFAVEGAAAAAASAFEAVPFPWNIAAGPAAGALAFAAIMGIRSQIGYQRGGYTGDGPPGEAAGVVHRGEFVIPAGPLAQAMRRGGAAAMTAGGQSVTIINNETNNWDLLDASQVSKARRMKNAKVLAQDGETLKARGIVRPPRKR